MYRHWKANLLFLETFRSQQKWLTICQAYVSPDGDPHNFKSFRCGNRSRTQAMLLFRIESVLLPKLGTSLFNIYHVAKWQFLRNRHYEYTECDLKRTTTEKYNKVDLMLFSVWQTHHCCPRLITSFNERCLVKVSTTFSRDGFLLSPGTTLLISTRVGLKYDHNISFNQLAE